MEANRNNITWRVKQHKKKLTEVMEIVQQEVQKAQAAQLQGKLLVSKCTSFRELKRLGRSGSSLLKGVGRHSKNQVILKILATFDLTQIQLECFGEELDHRIPSN